MSSKFLSVDSTQLQSSSILSASNIYSQNNNVGINKPNPTYQLDVNGQLSVNNNTIVNVSNGVNSTDCATVGQVNVKIGATTTDTLQNKTIDATLNTITNLSDSNVASLSANKIGSGSVNNTTFAYLDATSSVQTQLNSKLGSTAGSTLNMNSNDITNCNNFTCSNFTANGTATLLNTTSLSVNDSLCKVGANNTSTDIISLGQYGAYNDGSGVKYTSIYRDQSISNRPWTFCTGLTSEPTSNTITPASTGFVFAPISCGQVNCNTNKLVNVLDPSASTDGATKNYVDTNFLPKVNPLISGNIGTISGQNTISVYVNGTAMSTFDKTNNKFQMINGTQIDVNSNKILNVANGTTTNDAVNYGQLSSYLPLSAGSGNPLSGDLYLNSGKFIKSNGTQLDMYVNGTALFRLDQTTSPYTIYGLNGAQFNAGSSKVINVSSGSATGDALNVGQLMGYLPITSSSVLTSQTLGSNGVLSGPVTSSISEIQITTNSVSRVLFTITTSGTINQSQRLVVRNQTAYSIFVSNKPGASGNIVCVPGTFIHSNSHLLLIYDNTQNYWKIDQNMVPSDYMFFTYFANSDNLVYALVNVNWTYLGCGLWNKSTATINSVPFVNIGTTNTGYTYNSISNAIVVSYTGSPLGFSVAGNYLNTSLSGLFGGAGVNNFNSVTLSFFTGAKAGWYLFCLYGQDYDGSATARTATISSNMSSMTKLINFQCYSSYSGTGGGAQPTAVFCYLFQNMTNQTPTITITNTSGTHHLYGFTIANCYDYNFY